MRLLPLAPEASASASSATSAVEIVSTANQHYNLDRAEALCHRNVPSPSVTQTVESRRHVYDVGVSRPVVLWTLLSSFALRVLGQLLVVAGIAPFLPPMDEWQSGLLPYPLLLTSQVLILAVLGIVCLQFSRGEGYFVRQRPSLATPLWTIGWIYALAMIVRYMLLRRDEIPVVFHIVLASFLLVVAQHHRQALRQG
jgi:hypothetical protein